MWENIRRETGIDSFHQQEFEKIENNLLERLASCPTYLAEVLFSKAYAYYRKMKRHQDFNRRKR
jgi:hypothetical protein